MKRLPDGMQEHLESGATTLCWCWRATRRDGVVMGFTDHDRDVEFEGTRFEAAAGFTASEIKESIGLSVDNLEVSSALSSERISEADLAAGRFDDARVEIFRVNWQDTSQRVLMRSGSVGEVRRSGNVFTAEVRGLAHYLQQPRGRVFQYGCDADLGDARCGIDFERPEYRGEGSLTEIVDGRRFGAEGLDAFASDWFTRGLLTFTSGTAAGQSVEVKRHVSSNSGVTIELWHAARSPLQSGQTFVVRAGCDKAFRTCAERFSNAANYRGFPHMPGNDLLTAVVRQGGRL